MSIKNIQDIRSLIKNDVIENDNFIVQSLSSDVVLINQISKYIINSGGKRLRPLLVMLFSRALGYEGSKHHSAAAIIEFIHTATLLHDDVVDESELRRGKKTANNVFGNSASVLTGDFLYSRAFQLMVRLDNMNIMQILADATNKISEGEVMQLLNTRKVDLSEDEYIKVIYCKTSKLFEAACDIAATISLDENKYNKYKEKIQLYGVYLGNAFQIADDVLDYTSNYEDMGKNVGDDLNEGKMTLPLIYSYSKASSDDKEKIKTAIEDSNYNLDEIIDIIKKSGSIDYSYEKACYYADKAKEQLDFIDDSEFKKALKLIADIAVKRSN